LISQSRGLGDVYKRQTQAVLKAQKNQLLTADNVHRGNTP
jgi:hypothetical protein